ncbi:MAG: MucB/RseB C-terminal domain-containing protein [Burkholderiales bacterium]|nr:MucB/RseB C-terminal domain-containing protein [Burkholderiales bacterium]
MKAFGKTVLPLLLLSQVLLVCTARADALGDAEALALLQRIAQAARELNYRGTFVYQHGNHAESSRITHFVDPSGEFEKLETLDGPRREIIRNSSEIITFYADTGVVKRERRTARKVFPALLPAQLSVLTEYYQLRKAGQDRIAGYDAQALVLEPRDRFRYGHKLWAEMKTGLLLKARMLDGRGEVMEQFHFTEVSIDVPLTKDAVAPRFAIPAAPQREIAQTPTDTGWAVQNQPAGFKKIMEMHRQKQAGGGLVSHLVFSDGLAAVSVFIEPMPSAKIVPGLSHQGAVSIYTRPLSDKLITVLGETPPVTVMQIANSVSPKAR